MNFTWEHLVIIIIVVQLNYVLGQTPNHKVVSPKDWKTVESLFEQYPYIVALLNISKKYMCTGITIKVNTVLTSGSCIDPALYYIAVGLAVVSSPPNNDSLFEIASTKLHTDYTYEFKASDPNVTQTHSNIGIVFSVIPNLNYAYIPHADLGNYFASELQDKNVRVIGYGTINETNTTVLQHQSYHQSPCMNPKWYYCICGVEYSTYSKTYENTFGKGAPVFFGNQVIGIAVTPCGTLELPSDEIKYNIFTVLGPYLPWLEKETQGKAPNILFRARDSAHRVTDVISEFCFLIPRYYTADLHEGVILRPAQSQHFNYESELLHATSLVFARNMSKANKWEPLSRVGIIGVPFEKGQKKYGVSVAPAAMRAAGLIEELKDIGGLDVKDYGDIDISACAETVAVDNMAHLPLVSECNRKLSSKVSQVLKDGRVAVTIGGDHSIGVGTVDGHYNVNDDMILIWVDAHADINTNKTSDSGSVHGMPVALLVKELSDYWPYLPTMDWQVPKFSIKNLGYVGLRSVDTYERLAIEKYEVPAFAMEDIEQHGIQKSIHHILKVLDPDMNKPIHVSFDIDSLDALEAPSTGTPVRGGLTLREAICLMEIIHSTGRLRAVDLVEINPALGNDSDRRRTLEAGLSILKAALGFSRRGTAPRGVLDLPVQTYH